MFLQQDTPERPLSILDKKNALALADLYIMANPETQVIMITPHSCLM